MHYSAGILFVWNSHEGKKVLLVHATNSPWWKSYGPPKGLMDEGEIPETAACRETEEEVGIRIPQAELKNLHVVDYRKGSGPIYKKVFVYVHAIDSLSEIGLNSPSVSKANLQLEEVDDARFFDEEEAKKRCHKYFLPLIDQVFSNSSKV